MLNRMLHACLLLILSLLMACSPVGPAYHAPVTSLPARFVAAEGQGIATTAAWWQLFGDAQLDVLIQRALHDSHELQLVQAKLQQARALQGIQQAAQAPGLNVGAKLVEDHISKNSEMLANIPSKNITTQFTNYQVGFDASWELDFFGRLQHLTDAAAARTAAQSLRVEDVRLVLAAEVARNYVEYRMWQQRAALATASLPYYQDAVRLAELLLKVGEGSAAEVQRAANALHNYQAVLPTYSLGMRQNLIALTLLTGQDLATLTTQLAANTPLLSVPEAPAAGLPSDLLKRRADVWAAEQEIKAANADIGAALAEMYPRFSLLGNVGWLSISAGSLLHGASQAWSIGPSVSVPLFNRGRLQGQVNLTTAALTAAKATYAKVVLSAVADVETALSRMASSEQRRQQLLAANTAQRQLVDLIELQKHQGEMTQMAVLEARRTLANQEDQYLQAQTQSLTAYIALHKALGGGFANTRSSQQP